MKKFLFFLSIIGIASQRCYGQTIAESRIIAIADSGLVRFEQEKHLKNVRQLTEHGENAEAYWSFDNTKLTFQRTNKTEGLSCDQIFFGDVAQFTEKVDLKDSRVSTPYHNMQSQFNFSLVSTGKGRTTCSFFLPGDTLIIYASTHLNGDSCPPVPPYQHGKYLWSLYPSYEIFIADLKGNIVKQLTSNNFYDAEAVVSPRGDKILFTSDRSGDLELYTMNLDGSDVSQITNELGYDGGANFSPDGSQIIWRASHFDTDAERAEYQKNLKRHLVSPMKMELFISNADGSNRRQITNLGSAN